MHGRTPDPVIHGDLKPANILLDTEGRIWLVDFGLARPHLRTVAGDTHDGRERPSGTPGYTPVEQWHGRVEPRSDVYALGATLFEMLTRRRPSLDPSELVLALRRAAPPVSAETERLLQRALAFDAARRPEAGELLALLERSLVKIALPPPPPPEQPPSGERFLGRDAELRAIDARLSADRSLLLVGMPGIGKTALLGALCGPRAESDTLFYHTCLADSGLDELTYQLCAHLARQGDTAPWEYLQRARLRDDHSNLARTLVDQILAALPRQAAGPALLICLDDAHLLADDPTAAALLAGLRRLARDGALRLVVASRVALASFTEVELFRLEGLGPEAAAALLGSRRVDLDPTVLGELHRLTGGNAQFLILASDLLARGQDGPALIAGLASAPDVERYLIAEVDEGLSREERQVMQAVAALEEAGGTRDLIEHVVGRGAKRVLRALADRQLLLRRSAEDELFFQHALVRAFYADLPSRGERIRLHRGAASYFQEISPDNLQAAYHLLRAGEVPQAAGLAVASSADAMNRGRLNRLRGLLEQIPVDGLAPELSTAVLLARGDAEAFAGAASAARASFLAALSRLEQAGDEPWRRVLTARTCRSLAGALEHEAPVEALGWIQRGLEALRNDDPVEAALLLHRQGSLHMALGAYETAEGVLERALTGLPEAMIDRRADTLINLGISACARGLREIGVARLRAALDLYRRTGNRWGEGTAYQNLGIDSDYAGDWQEAAAYYGQALVCAEVTGSVERQAHLALLLGTLATQRGDDVGAEAHLGRCVALSAEHQLLEYRAMALSSLAELHIARGSYAAAAVALEQAEQLAGQLGERFHQLPEIYRGWALVLAQSDGGRAEAKARQALALAQAPAFEGLLHLWVEEPGQRRETVVDFRTGGNPGKGWARTAPRSNPGKGWARTAPVLSSDGQAIIFTPDGSIGEGQFFTLMASDSPPPPPAWATPVSRAYRLSSTPGVTFAQLSLNIGYMGDEVPGRQEANIITYYWNEELSPPRWEALEAYLDVDRNEAAAAISRPGLYQLMTSLALPLERTGWNLVPSYPGATQPLAEALGGSAGRYTTIYGYEAGRAGSPWQLFDVDVPLWVNNLDQLRANESYWIRATRPTSLLVRSASLAGAGPAQSLTLPPPPATYYGELPADLAGAEVVATIGGAVCGRSTARSEGDGAVFVVHVEAAGVDQLAGCGGSGKQVTVAVGELRFTAPWRNDRPQPLTPGLAAPGPDIFVYLPAVQR